MSVLQLSEQNTVRRIQRIQTITIVWMAIEAVVSLAAASIARSPALLAFGGDSAIELLSAIVVLWRFRARALQEESESLAARIVAVLLFMLAAYVVVVSVITLSGLSEAKTTYLGIAILIAAASIMPWLAREKAGLQSWLSGNYQRSRVSQRSELMPLNPLCALTFPWLLWLDLESTRFGT